MPFIDSLWWIVRVAFWLAVFFSVIPATYFGAVGLVCGVNTRDWRMVLFSAGCATYACAALAAVMWRAT